MASISYEVSKFSPKPNAELLCAICFCVIHEARMCPCHHIFCNVCIRKWLENSLTCPSCRSPVNLRQLKLAPPLVQNVINSLTMDCDYKDQGCDQSISKENFPSHTAKCEYRPMSCPHKDCTVETTVRDLPTHTKECQYRSLQCRKRCRLPLPAYKLENHDCFTAMQDKIQEMHGILHKHQMVLSWIRKKFNNVQLPEQSPGVQLQAYREMIADINQYWPEDQLIPLLLCGTYLAPSAPTASNQVRSSSSTDHCGENEYVSENTLERLVAEASNSQSRPRVFGPRDPNGADGPTVHVVRNTPVRGIVHEEDIEIDSFETMHESYFSSDDSETWESSTEPTNDSYFNDPQDDSGTHTYRGGLPSQGYNSPHASAPRGSRRYDDNTRGQDSTFVDQTLHSPEQARSGFEEDHSYQAVDSSGNISSYSDREHYTSTSRSSVPHSHQYQSSSSNVNSRNSTQHHQDNDPSYADWNYASSRADYRSRHSDSRYYSRSRSRSYSPQDERRSPSRSYSPTGQYTPSRSGSGSYSPQRSYSRSRSRSSENSESDRRYDRSYSASPSLLHSRSGSRSLSTSRGRSSSRSPDHQQSRSRSPSFSSERSCSTSNQTQEEQFSDTDYWTRTDDLNNGSAEEQDDWTPSWDNGDEGSNDNDDWAGSERRLEEQTRAEHEMLTPVQSSHGGEQRRQADSTSRHYQYNRLESHNQGTHSDESEGRVESEHNVISPASESFDPPYLHLSPYYREGLQERRLISGVSDNACGENGQANNLPEDIIPDQNQEEFLTAQHTHTSSSVVQASMPKDSLSPQAVRTSRSPTENAALTEMTSEVDGDRPSETGRSKVLQCPTPCYSNTKNENSALDQGGKLKSDQRGLSSERPYSAKKNKKSSYDETSRNVWESSSDTTSLDYEIPPEDATPKSPSQSDMGTECKTVNEVNVEQNDDGILLEAGDASDRARMRDSRDIGKRGHRKYSSSHYYSDRGDNSDEDSDENVSGCRTRGEVSNSSRAKGKGPLKVKRKKVLPIDSDSESDSTEDDDSNVCFKRKMKVKLPDLSSDSEGFSRENETAINQTDRDTAHKAATQSNIPSTSCSHSSSNAACVAEGKVKKKKRSDKKKIKYSPFKSKGIYPQKMKVRKRKTQKSHSSSKRARHDSSHKENGAAVENVSNKSVHVEHPSSQLKLQTSNIGTGAQLGAQIPPSHGDEGTRWTGRLAENQRRSTRSHTFSRQDLERADGGMENIDSSSVTASSRGRRLSHRSLEADGRRGNERRVIESESIRRVQDISVPQGVSSCRQERERGNPPVHTGGRRIMRIDNTHGRMDSRQQPHSESTRTVLISDLPVPPTTFDLLNEFDNSDESDSTWSPSSSRTESSSTL